MSQQPLRIAFMGSPDFAVPALQALLDSPHQVVAVYSQAPKPKGRGHVVQPCPVHALAERHQIPVYTPKTLRTAEAQAAFAALDLDVAVVAAYGLILPQAVLQAPRAGCLNLHGSLLPRWRGAAPIQRAIEAGDTQTGICLMAMDEGLDTGGVYAATALPITPQTTNTSLAAEMAQAGAVLLMQHLDAIVAGALPCQPQPADGMTYAKKIDKAEARINWAEDAAVIERRLRAFTPWPLLECVVGGEVVKVIEAELVTAAPAAPAGTLLAADFTVACGTGALRILKAQRPNRSAMSGIACLQSLSLAPLTVLPCAGSSL